MWRRSKNALNPEMRNRYRERAGPFTSLIAVVCVLLAPALVGAQESQDLYLLDFHADGYLLAESVPAYASGETFLIDFALFLEAVEFPIESRASSGRAGSTPRIGTSCGVWT